MKTRGPGGPGGREDRTEAQRLLLPLLRGQCPELSDPICRLLWPRLCGRLPLEPLSEPGVMSAPPRSPPWLYLRLCRWLFWAPLRAQVRGGGLRGREGLAEGRVTEIWRHSPGCPPPGWTSSARGAGGGAQPVAPATAMFTGALTPTATRQTGSVTARCAWPLTPDLLTLP